LVAKLGDDDVSMIIQMDTLLLQSTCWSAAIAKWDKITAYDFDKMAQLPLDERYEIMMEIVPLYLHGVCKALRSMLDADLPGSDDDADAFNAKILTDAKALQVNSKTLVEFKAYGITPLKAHLFLGDVASGGSTWSPCYGGARNIGSFFMSLDYGLRRHPRDEVKFCIDKLDKVMKNLKLSTSASRFAVIVFHSHEDTDAVRKVMAGYALGGFVQHLVRDIQ
jgi:hypothetical protein